MARMTTATDTPFAQEALAAAAFDKPPSDIDLVLFIWHAAFQPGSKPRFADGAYFDNPGTPLSARELREGLRKRWGHAGCAGHIPTARRPYARRSTRRFVEETPDYTPEVLHMLGVQQEHFALPGRAGALGRTFRLWICPHCNRRVQRLYPLYPLDTPNKEAGPDRWTRAHIAACRACAGLVYRSQYIGQRLLTPERIAEALTRGPRRRTSPARLRYELRILTAACQLDARNQHWQQLWVAAMTAWVAWHELQAQRLGMRVARMQVTARSGEQQQRQKQHAEVAQWQRRVKAAHARFRSASAHFDELARVAA